MGWKIKDNCNQWYGNQFLSNLHILDNMDYFLNKVICIMNFEYSPSKEESEDLLKVYV